MPSCEVELCTPDWMLMFVDAAYEQGAKAALLSGCTTCSASHLSEGTARAQGHSAGCLPKTRACQRQTLTAAGSRPPQRPTATHTTGIPHRCRHCPRFQHHPLQSPPPLWRTACGQRSARSHPWGRGSSLAHWRSMSLPAPAGRCPSSLGGSPLGCPEEAGCMAAQVNLSMSDENSCLLMPVASSGVFCK